MLLLGQAPRPAPHASGRFRADEPVEDIQPGRQNLQFLYRDDRLAYFMNLDTFEQVAIENRRLGRAVSFLAEAITVPVEFVDAQTIGTVFPEIVDVRVADTAPAAR